jgi:hypothetical protein
MTTRRRWIKKTLQVLISLSVPLITTILLKLEKYLSIGYRDKVLL